MISSPCEVTFHRTLFFIHNFITYNRKYSCSMDLFLYFKHQSFRDCWLYTTINHLLFLVVPSFITKYSLSAGHCSWCVGYTGEHRPLPCGAHTLGWGAAGGQEGETISNNTICSDSLHIPSSFLKEIPIFLSLNSIR